MNRIILNYTIKTMNHNLCLYLGYEDKYAHEYDFNQYYLEF